VTRVTGQTNYQLENLVMWSNLDAATVDDEIDSQTAYFNAIGHNFEWLVYGHDAPKDLVQRLKVRGFECESEEQVVIAEPETIGEHSVPAGVELMALEDPDRVADVVAIQSAVWGRGQYDFLTRWLTKMLLDRPEESIVLVAYADGQPIASAWATLWDHREFAPLFGGSVLPEWRGQGIYRAMVSARVAAAAARGSEVEKCAASDMARPVFSANGVASDKTHNPPCIHKTRAMARNGKSRVSKEGLPVKRLGHLVGYHYLPK